MTGEMYHIDQEGNDSNGECWPIHAAIAKALRDDGHNATLQPFDAYQGPYILVGEDIRVGKPPYQLAVQNQGVTRLWLCGLDIECFLHQGCIYREDTNASSEPFWLDNIEGAVACAKELMARTKEVVKDEQAQSG